MNHEELILWRLKEIERQLTAHAEAARVNYEKTEARLDKLSIDVTTLKTKASAWGAIAGGIIAALVTLGAAVLHAAF